MLKVYDSKGFDASSTIFDYDGNAHTFAKAVLTLDKSNKTTAKESDFEIKYVDNVAGKKTETSDEDGINIGWVYAVAKEGTGFAGDGSWILLLQMVQLLKV